MKIIKPLRTLARTLSRVPLNTLARVRPSLDRRERIRRLERITESLSVTLREQQDAARALQQRLDAAKGRK